MKKGLQARELTLGRLCNQAKTQDSPNRGLLFAEEPPKTIQIIIPALPLQGEDSDFSFFVGGGGCSQANSRRV